MTFFLATDHNFYTILKCLEAWETRLGNRLVPVSYSRLTQSGELPVGTYIFSDIDRLTSDQTVEVARIWDQLSREKQNHLLNHPTHSLKRYDLLRALYERGWNSFNVYQLEEARNLERFPVFVRCANDHKGASTPLLQGQNELDRAINDISDSGESLKNKIVIEFCDTSDERGIFRKYSAYIIGDKIIPSMVSFRPDWHVKASTDLLGEQLHPEKVEYLKTNPHQVELRKIFQAAQIDYGRIDYAMLNGKIQTWEINTNPDISSLSTRPSDPYNKVDGLPLNEYLSEKFAQAFEAIDTEASNNACTWHHWHRNKMEELLAVMEPSVPVGSRVLWADNPEGLGVEKAFLGRHLIPFLEQDGIYLGPPQDDSSAIRELERLRTTGAEFLIFIWSSFWWFEYYPQFFSYLESQFSFLVDNELLVVCDLRPSASPEASLT